MSEVDRDALIESTLTAHREREVSGVISFSPAWWDLSGADREEAFTLQLATRYLEQAMDPEGLSATAHVVVGQALRTAQLRR